MNPFLLANEKIGGIEVRPFSAVTELAIAALSDLKFTRLEQAASMLWMQMRPPAEVKQAISDGTIEAKVRALAEEMPLAYLRPVEDWAERQHQMILEGRVEIIPRESSGGAEPGN